MWDYNLRFSLEIADNYIYQFTQLLHFYFKNTDPMSVVPINILIQPLGSSFYKSSHLCAPTNKYGFSLIIKSTNSTNLIPLDYLKKLVVERTRLRSLSTYIKLNENLVNNSSILKLRFYLAFKFLCVLRFVTHT